MLLLPIALLYFTGLCLTAKAILGARQGYEDDEGFHFASGR